MFTDNSVNQTFFNKNEASSACRSIRESPPLAFPFRNDRLKYILIKTFFPLGFIYVAKANPMVDDLIVLSSFVTRRSDQIMDLLAGTQITFPS